MPTIDVIIVTYNHENFIAQAIESALIQKTTFSVMINIADDCSTDKTQEIVKSYYNRYPDKINIALDTKHRGPQSSERKFLQLLRDAKAKYITILEGDDYWTDPYKLQKQVDFLESNPEYSMCCHPVNILYCDNRVRHWKDKYGVNKKVSYTIEEIIETWPEVPIAGLVFRRSALPELPEWFGTVLRGDSALLLLLAHNGKLGFINEHMAVHRKHAGGVSALFDTDPDYMRYDFLKILINIDKQFNFKYHHLLRKYVVNETRSFLDNPSAFEWIQKLIEFCRSDPKREKVLESISGIENNEAKKINQEAEARFAQRDIEGAKILLYELTNLWPMNYIAYNNLGVIAWATGDTQNSLIYFTKALIIAPYDKNIIMNFGSILISIGETQLARKLFMQYLEKNPDDKEVSNILSDL